MELHRKSEELGEVLVNRCQQHPKGTGRDTYLIINGDPFDQPIVESRKREFFLLTGGYLSRCNECFEAFQLFCEHYLTINFRMSCFEVIANGHSLAVNILPCCYILSQNEDDQPGGAPEPEIDPDNRNRAGVKKSAFLASTTAQKGVRLSGEEPKIREGPEWRRRATGGRPEVRGSTRGRPEMNRKTGNGPEMNRKTGNGPEGRSNEEEDIRGY
ncbi:hypothetical protein B0H10DRAFT_1958324 [Mycena sp. CBHHK59/15]|nr:hypothetical protein B0H10DRAFT_1958324 [Mycena sp. CBHHK59/15]